MEENNRELLKRILDHLRANGPYDQMKQYVVHSDIIVYEHCVKVAVKCLELVEKHRIACNKEMLVRCALLHDYYLYDWHIPEKGRKLHGTHHQLIAAANAIRDYQISEKEARIIRSHMFPLPPQYVPFCREAWILTWADKIVATGETLKKYRK